MVSTSNPAAPEILATLSTPTLLRGVAAVGAREGTGFAVAFSAGALVTFSLKTARDPEGQHLVTPAKRRQALVDQRAAKRANSTQTTANFQEAWRKLQASMPRGAPQMAAEDCEETSDGIPGLTIHETHVCMACGGFVGCLHCGSVAATPLQGALARPCRGSMPFGSTRPIRKLVLGIPPRGTQWPSGEEAPRPKRLRGA